MEDKKNGFWIAIKPWLGSVLLIPVILYFVFNRYDFHFIDWLNLLIHEGGHGVFSLFPDFIYMAGGTLMQIIIPSMFMIYFMKNHKAVPAQIFAVWLGQNLINISVYAGDALKRQLPLIGGKGTRHDWTYLLIQLDLLDKAELVGDIIFYTSLVVFAFALIMPLFVKAYENIDLDLSKPSGGKGKNEAVGI